MPVSCFSRILATGVPVTGVVTSGEGGGGKTLGIPDLLAHATAEQIC
jgi:hypothetical protein